jgi:hypothetical protein
MTKRISKEPIVVLSLGAGVQSSTLALMASAGKVQPMPDAAIFADTHAEPKDVYDWLDWLEPRLAFPVYRTSAGSLEENEVQLRVSKKTGKLNMKATIPAYVLKPNGTTGLLGRKCTRDFKVRPIHRAARKLMNKMGKKRVHLWIGISKDEAHRMKPSGLQYMINFWPLIDLGMSRQDCINWMRDNGYPEPPRSSCRFCPFHSDKEWIRLRDKHPDDFSKAAQFEKRLQEAAKQQEGLTGIPFLHRDCIPLEDVKFSENPAHSQISLFGNECEGLCGV